MAQNDSFAKRQEEAVKQMREMSYRASGTFHNMPPAPPFVKLPDRPQNTATEKQEPKRQRRPEGVLQSYNIFLSISISLQV